MYLAPNKEDAEKIITHPDIYPHVRDDGSFEPHHFEMPDGMIGLVVYDPFPVACTAFHWRNSSTCEVHVQILPDHRKKSFEYGKLMLEWIWDNIAVDKLIGLVSDRKTLLFTLRLGFRKEGVSKSSLMRNGKLIDQTYIGMERCQQQSPSYQQ